MPHWLVFHPPEVFATLESKQALAEDITPIYTSVGLPAFYVVVNFIAVPKSNTFVGGKPKTESEKPFVRITVDHIAVHLEGDAERHKSVTERIEAALKPHIADKGYDWEFHVDETPRGLWRVNGLVPPPWKSEAEKKWKEANAAIEWQ